MCGLVGVAGLINIVQKDVFTELLLVDVVRGHHATGAAFVNRNDKVFLTKAPMPSPMFIGTEQYNKFIKELDLKCIIGHNRYATIGEKTVENSHPFEFEKVVGAHNGTIDSWTLKWLADYEKFGTDSEAIYNLINNEGLKKAIAQLTGAWALTYFDKVSDSVNLIRNEKRPLFYAYSEDRKNLYWASEADMLEWVLKRNKVKIFDKNVFECTPDQQYRWTIPKKSFEVFEKPMVAIVEGKSFSKTAWADEVEDYGFSFGHRTEDHWRYNPANYTGTKLPALPAPSLSTSVSTGNVVHFKPVNTKKFRPPYKDAYGRIINKVNFEKLVETGCVMCDQKDSKWGDFIQPLKDDMDGRKLYLCEPCYNEPEILDLFENMM